MKSTNNTVYAKLSYWNAYNKNKTEANLRGLKAEIYELYCHEQIFINSDENTIMVPVYKKAGNKGQLRISKIGKILYYSDEVNLAEFDILGMNGSSILWYEVTTAKQATEQVKAALKRKRFILEQIFPCSNIVLTLLVPEITEFGVEVNQHVIEEPMYKQYLMKQFMPLKIESKSCLDFNVFKNSAKEYSYIGHVLKTSIEHFDGDKVALNRIKSEGVIERLYDFKNINNNNFKYYDVAKQQYGVIKVRGTTIKKDNEYVSKRKKTYDEVIKLRKLAEHKKRTCLEYLRKNTNN